MGSDLILHFLDDLSLPPSASLTELSQAAGHLSGPQTRPAGSCFGAFALAVPFTQRHFSHIWMPHLEFSAQMSPPHRGHQPPIKTSLSHTLLCCHFCFLFGSYLSFSPNVSSLVVCFSLPSLPVGPVPPEGRIHLCAPHLCIPGTILRLAHRRSLMTIC